MRRNDFARLVERALRRLPPQFGQRLDNVAIVIKRAPSQRRLERLGVPSGDTLLGVYEGIALPDRAAGYNMAVPDQIIIFREPIEDKCDGDPDKIVQEVERTVIHEIAHYFGIGDAELEEMGWG